MMNKPSGGRLLKLLAPMIVLSLVFASCSSKTDEAEQTTTTVAEAPVTTEVTEVDDKGPERLVPADGVEIDKEAQYAGWVFEFEQISSDEEDADDDEADDDFSFVQPVTLEVAMKYTNLTDESGDPRVSFAIEVEDDGTTELLRADTDMKEVPGQGTGKGSFTVVLDEEQAELFSLDTATIVLGDDDKTQARVPLGDDGDLVSLKPQEQTPGFEDFTIGDWEFEVTSTELRWDGIFEHNQADKGVTWLAVTADATAGEEHGRFGQWEWAFTSPDGLSSTGEPTQRADGEGSTQWQDPGTTVKGYVFWFILETPVDGEYEFTFTGPFGPDGAEVSETMKVELEALDSADADDAADSDDDADADADADDSDTDKDTDDSSRDPAADDEKDDS